MALRALATVAVSGIFYYDTPRRNRDLTLIRGNSAAAAGNVMNLTIVCIGPCGPIGMLNLEFGIIRMDHAAKCFILSA